MTQDSKTTETTETFQERIARMKDEERAAAIAAAQTKQREEDDADTIVYRKSYFNNPALPFGSVIKVDGNKAVIQFEESVTAKYPMKHMNDEGQITVARAGSLVVRNGKKERIAITPTVGQRGVVEQIAFNGIVDLVFILDDREAKSE